MIATVAGKYVKIIAGVGFQSRQKVKPPRGSKGILSLMLSCGRLTSQKIPSAKTYYWALPNGNGIIAHRDLVPGKQGQGF